MRKPVSCSALERSHIVAGYSMVHAVGHFFVPICSLLTAQTSPCVSPSPSAMTLLPAFASPVAAPVSPLRSSFVQSVCPPAPSGNCGPRTTGPGATAPATRRRAAAPVMTLADAARSSTPMPQTSVPAEVDVLVVGTGVSGSSLAHALMKNVPDLSLLVTEAKDVVGGNVISRQENGYTWEEGPNTFQPAAHIMRLAVDLGLKDDIVLADHTLPRFVYWDGNLFALPLGPQDIPKFRLLSILGAIRAGLGAAGFVLPNLSGKEESIKEFITRHLGSEVFAKMIDPFVSGVYAGNPAKLSMKSAFKKIYALQELGITQGIVEGAVIRLNQRKKEAPPVDPELPTWKSGALGSFRNGLGMLPKAVAVKVGADRLRLGWKLTHLSKTNDGRYCATYDTPEGVQTVVARTVALTAPAQVASSILSGVAPEAAALNDIEYPLVWSITLAYPKSEFKKPLSGFGNLIPRSMGIQTLGCIWSSCLFEGRAPEGMELLLNYIGGAQDSRIAGMTEEEVIAAVDGDVKRILLKDGSTVKPVVVGARKWPRAIPQYNLGYASIMEKVNTSLQRSPGIFLGGNYTTGVAFGDCVQWGLDAADGIAAYVKTSSNVV
jgi:protoporphyrinogen/coproporphyrinogen III oxidase